MKSIAIIYTGPMPEIEVPIHGVAKRNGQPILVTEDVAKDFLARGDWIEAKQARRNSKPE